MSFIVLIGLLSSICSIIGLFISDRFKSNRWFYVIFIFIMTFASGYAVHYNSELERINNIHRQAIAISEHYTPYGGYKEYIQESLTFLEENRDKYPEAYERAKDIYFDLKVRESKDDFNSAKEIHGIIKGIATISHE